MSLRPVLSLSLLLALGACASAPIAAPEQDAEAKRFDRPPPDSGALYVYRSGWFGIIRPLDVGVAGGAQAALPANSYLRLEGPPGPVEVNCKVGDKSGQREVQVVPGETRYVEVSMTAGLWGPDCAIAEVPPDQGQAAVRSSKRVMPQSQ